jgi:FkbM family methyltransferase
MSSFSHVDHKNVPLDQKLDQLFKSKQSGFFIELGAHDGLTQSNTAFFELTRGWRGVLVEPSPNAFDLCRQRRTNSRCFNAACVEPNFGREFVEGDFNGDVMNSINGSRLQQAATVRVQARTLESILDEAGAPASIDLLSLDTEGYELPILRGMNLKRYRPRFMLIEVYNKQFDEIVEFLALNRYMLMCNFTKYNPVDNPRWDGTHNDYLFMDASLLK